MNDYYGIVSMKAFVLTSTDEDGNTIVLFVSPAKETAEALKERLDDADTAGRYAYEVYEVPVIR